MLKLLISAMTCLVFSVSSFAQEPIVNPGIQITKKLLLEFKEGHSCMTQTRAETKEEALYTTDKCGPVKYELSNKGKKFTIFQKNEKDKWYAWGTYKVQHSFTDVYNNSERFLFFCEDGSSITYVPEVESSPLVILDLSSEELIHFIYD